MTLLAPALYAYVAFNSAAAHDSSVYLRLPFPLVISMFYGYFAQVERVKRLVKEKEEQARQQQEAAEEIRRQRERLEVLHEINVAVASTIESTRIPQRLPGEGDNSSTLRGCNGPVAAPGDRASRDCGVQRITTIEFATSINPLGLADEIFEARSLVTVGSVFEDARIKDCELFQREGSFLCRITDGCQWRNFWQFDLFGTRRTSFR